MSLLSKTCVYGIRAMIRLASQEDASGPPVRIRAIADELDIPFHFLTKIFQRFTQRGLLASVRGAAGGVRLARPPAEITLAELVLALDDSQLLTSCVLGLGGCGDQKPCPMHGAWAVERARLKNLFENTCLGTLARQFNEQGLRLSDFLGDIATRPRPPVRRGRRPKIPR